MKNTITLILILSIVSFSCVAQKKIATLKTNSIVEANAIKYRIEKSGKMVTVENTQNTLTNFKQKSPNMPDYMDLKDFDIKLDVKQITKILAANISVNDLETLSKDNPFSILLVVIKGDAKGVPLEVSFGTRANSILTLNQLEEIEKSVKTNVRFIIDPYAERFIKGSNFITRSVGLSFTQILKEKRKL